MPTFPFHPLASLIRVDLYKKTHERAGIFFVSISIMIPHHIPHGTWGEFGTARADCYGLKMHFHDNYFFSRGQNRAPELVKK